MAHLAGIPRPASGKTPRRIKTATDFYASDFHLDPSERFIDCAACGAAHNGPSTSLYSGDGQELTFTPGTILCHKCWKAATQREEGCCPDCWTPLDKEGHCVSLNIHMI
jgi:hypothetical protein